MKTTYMAKPSEIKRNWYIIDAKDKPLGRVATEAARLLRGKHKPIYTPHIDTGDHVIVLNAEKVILTGKKLEQKEYITHSRRSFGLKKVKYEVIMKEKPEKALEKAIRGMLPHNRLGRAMAKKMQVYRGAEHPHEAQKPEGWNF